jgi:hypothetical protein
MTAKSWEELILDWEQGYALALSSGTDRWIEAFAALRETISRVREHYSFQSVEPMISLAALALHTSNRSIILYIYRETLGTPCHVYLRNLKTSTTFDETFVELDALVPTLNSYFLKVSSSAESAGQSH